MRQALPVGFLLLAGAMAATAAEIPLLRSNPRGVDGYSIPVSVGVPFPAGLLNDESAVQLFDAAGKAVPCQTAATSRWQSRSGSIQTLLVTFLADTANDKYVLRTNIAGDHRPSPRIPATVRHEGDCVLVSTGPLLARLGGQGSGFIQELAFDANRDGAITSDEIAVKSGSLACGQYSSAFGKPDRIEIEEAGPLRAIVRIAGHHQSADGQKFVRYDVRLTFYAGLSLVRIDHTFVQDTDQIFADIPFVSLDLPLDANKGTAIWGLDAKKAQHVPWTRTNRSELLQVGPGQKESIAGLENEEFRKIVEDRKRYWSPDEETRWTKGPHITEWAATLTGPEGLQKVCDKAAGWVRVVPEGKPWALTTGLRYFWQLHPKALAVDKGVLRIFPYPDSMSRPLHFHIGTAKTHTLFLLLNAANDADAAQAAVQAFFEPPMYFPQPQWYCDSGVWGHILPRRDGRFTLYESEAARTIHNDFVQRPTQSNWYGMLNFGDLGTMNLETAYDHGMAVHFIRTGDRQVFDSFERAVWHFRDVDVQQAKVPGQWDWGLWLMPGYMPEKLAQECARDASLRDKIFYWTGTQPPEIGGVHRHSYLHFANAATTPVPSSSRFPEKRLRMYSGSCDVGGHGWIVGLVDHYLLTGDRRSLEVAELAGQWVLRHGGTSWGRDNWKYINLAWLYRATGKKEYLQRLLEAIDMIHQDKESTVERIAAQDKTLMSPFYTILQFIKHVHQMTDDPGVRQKYLDLIDRWIDNVPTTSSSIGPVFEYIRDYRDSRCHTDFADLAYAYVLTGDRKYLDKSVNTLDFYLHFAYHSTAFFSVPEYLYALDKAGISALSDPAPSVRAAKAYWQDATDAPVHIVVYQQSGYRVPATATTGLIEITPPSGQTVTRNIERAGLDVYRLTVPPDGQKGIYKIEAKAKDCWFWFGANIPLVAGPPPVLAEGRYARGIRLADGAKLDIPADGHFNLPEGTIEMWLQPMWDAPSRRKEAVPYHYHVLFDSRDREYDYGFLIQLYDGGETKSGKTLFAAWADKDKADNVNVAVEWTTGDWHHIAFSWKRTQQDRGLMRLYIDGKLVAAKDDGAHFPAKLSPILRLGMNATESPNTPLNGVIDELRVSRTMREPQLSGPLEADADTLLLRHFDSEDEWRSSVTP